MLCFIILTTLWFESSFTKQLYTTVFCIKLCFICG